MLIDSRLNRIDKNRVRINNRQNIDAVLFANEDVPIQQTAVDELAQFLEVGDTIRQVFESAPEYYGEPVLVPGSIGASSFLLAGRGNAESICSASHGAGRALSRGDAQRGYDAEFKEFMERFRVVTPVDLRRSDIRQRRDIYEKKLDEIRQEAPYAYKGIGAITQTLTDANIAVPVAELSPLMTMKG